MKKIITIVALVATQSVLFAQTKWNVDKAHARLEFTAVHMSVSEVDGVFKDFDASVTASKPDFSDAKFELSAKVASINTDVDMRDADLKSDHFFDAANNPELTFVSTGIKATTANHYKLSGKMTMHGITKDVVLDLWYRGTIDNAMTKAKDAGFQVTGVVKRSDFKLGAQYPDAVISNDITIKANAEFAPAK
ncbi:YceI family protein [Mucilaginibacter sp. dw_454]|uniref:YceI family protein n=1 Tax=Mucilaginibacter sp. dw_454 TaxID=2720079 RepID=UPI001BD3DBCD|nr:YceI family protein [Mucilaginibacter sp. dw_454]